LLFWIYHTEIKNTPKKEGESQLDARGKGKFFERRLRSGCDEGRLAPTRAQGSMLDTFTGKYATCQKKEDESILDLRGKGKVFE
jgi:hypothetical protein